MHTKAQRVIRAIQGTVWAIQQDKLQEIGGVVAARFRSAPKLSAAEVSAITRSKTPVSRSGVVAVLPLHGTISQRMDMLTAFSGGTSTEQFARAFDDLIDDDDISAIVIDIDSPGGTVAGVPELAARIRAARGTKPIIAVANSLMCSAAYWIGSAADEIVATQLAFVASCNAIMVRIDTTASDAENGVAYHFISGGNTDHKAQGSPHFPVSEEELEEIQANVNVAFDAFMTDIAANRGWSLDEAKELCGQGLAYIAPRALDLKLIDRIGTLDSVVSELLGNKKQSSGARAQTPTTTSALAASTLLVPDGMGTITLPISNATALRVRLVADDEQVEDAAETADNTCPECGAPMQEGHCTECEYIAGSAAQTKTPSEQSTAPKAKEHTVEKENTAAESGAAIKAAERKRVSDLHALGAEHGVAADVVAQWVDGDTTPEAAAIEILRLQKDARAANPKVRPGATREHQKPFASFGEQLQAVAVHGGLDIPGINRTDAVGRLMELQAAATGHSATVGAEGGFLVGTQAESALMKRAYDNSTLASRCSVTPIGANADGLEVNMIKESSRATGSRYGGVRFYRTAEAETVTASKLGLEKWECRLEDLMAVTYLTERLMQDAPALQAEVEEAFGNEGAFVLDDEIFRGSGAGQCLGVKNSAAFIEVAKETSQVAATVVAENLMKAWARVYAKSRQTGAWFYNQALEPQLSQLSIKVKNVAGTENVGGFSPPMFLPAGFNGAETATIYGRPAIPIEQADAPGTAGDITYLDLSQYKLISKGGLAIAESMHVRFLYNERAFRFTFRINGKPKWSTALTPYKGSDTLSPFVGIAVRG